MTLPPQKKFPVTPLAPGPCLKKVHCSRSISKHAPGTVCILNMVLEHIWLKKFFQIINGTGTGCSWTISRIWSWTISRGQNLKKAVVSAVPNFSNVLIRHVDSSLSPLSSSVDSMYSYHDYCFTYRKKYHFFL